MISNIYLKLIANGNVKKGVHYTPKRKKKLQSKVKYEIILLSEKA